MIVGREDPGELKALLADQGATVLHVPLIATVDPDDGGRALRTELDRLGDYDWLVVSSVHGAERVGAAARTAPAVRLAAVGRSTAARLAELAGRPVDVVPRTQRAEVLAADLVEVMPASASLLIAAADRSEQRLEDDLRTHGFSVTLVVAYRTVLTPPDSATMDELLERADALLLTSGSSAESWADAPGREHFDGPIVAIGPSTAAAARRFGVSVTAVAADHSLSGLVRTLGESVAHGR